MDTVINKISAIESAATSVMDSANARKKEFAKEIEQRTAKFDADLEAETAQQIDELRKKMEVEMEAKLSKQKADAIEILQAMESNYRVNHESYAKKLFESMVEE